VRSSRGGGGRNRRGEEKGDRIEGREGGGKVVTEASIWNKEEERRWKRGGVKTYRDEEDGERRWSIARREGEGAGATGGRGYE